MFAASVPRGMFLGGHDLTWLITAAVKLCGVNRASSLMVFAEAGICRGRASL